MAGNVSARATCRYRDDHRHGVRTHRRKGSRAAQPGFSKAERLMTICNACRYCEGFCDVFPAMEKRRSNSPRPISTIWPTSATTAGPAMPPASSRRRMSSRSMCRRRWPWRAPNPTPPIVAARLLRAVRTQRPCHRRDRGAQRGGVHSRLRRLQRPAGSVWNSHRTGRLLCADAAQRDGAIVRRVVPLRHGRAGDGCARLLARHRRAGRDARGCALAVAGDRGMPESCAISMVAGSAASTTTSGRATGARSITI